MQKSILIAIEDTHLREVLQFALEKAGFLVRVSAVVNSDMDGAADAMLLDGALCAQWGSRQKHMPVLFIISRNEYMEHVDRLEAAGDDYIMMPFTPRELLARIGLMFRQSHAAKAEVKRGGICIDRVQHLLRCGDRSIVLTATECSMLSLLMDQADKVFSRDELSSSIDNSGDDAIDRHILRVRRKCQAAGLKNAIETVYGIGYRIGACQ